MPIRNRTSLDRAVGWIVQLYRDWGKPQQAAEWQQKLSAK